MGRKERRQFRLQRVRQVRYFEAARLARVGAHDPEAAGVRHDAHASAARHRLGVEQLRHVEELRQGVGADHTGLAEQRVHRHVGRGDEGAGVRAGGPGARLRAPALHRQDRLARAHPARQPRELPRVPERLEVEHDQVGRLVLLPVLQEVVAGDVRLVAVGDERREPEPECLRVIDHGESQGAALRQEADPPARGERRREGRVEAHRGIGVEHAEAVRADQSHARAAADVHELALPRGACRAALGETGGEHDERPHPLHGALARDLHNRRRRHRDHRELDRAGHVSDRSKGGNRENRVRVRVHGVHGTGESGLEDVAQGLVADGSRPLDAPTTANGRGGEERADGSGGRHALALVEAPPRLGAERRRELEVDRARHRVGRDREPALAEDLDHPVVLGQHLRLEPADAALFGGLRQMREQRRGDAHALHLVGHRERHLGPVLGGRAVGRVGDDPIVPARRDDPVAPGIARHRSAAPAAQSRLAPPEK